MGDSGEGEVLGGWVVSGPPTPEFQLLFLDFIQRVLDEGGFVATYKFALLMALADLSVEKGDESGDVIELHLDWIAQKFIQYYARQTVPYPQTEKKILHQNTGAQAKIVNLVVEAQAAYLADGRPIPVTRLAESSILIGEIASKVEEMPLYRLQKLGGAEYAFLYPRAPKGKPITLNPGIAFCFRRFYGFVTRLAQDGWIRHIRAVKDNTGILGEPVDLGVFLFGTSRAPLAEYKPILEEIQRGRCFYCDVERRGTDVDHFIPWSWYSLDLGHNFVLACKTCNANKKDRLAAVRHLERWARRNCDHGYSMAAAFLERKLPSDLAATMTVASWAYRRAENVAGSTWVLGKDHEPLDKEWARILAV